MSFYTDVVLSKRRNVHFGTGEFTNITDGYVELSPEMVYGRAAGEKNNGQGLTRLHHRGRMYIPAEQLTVLQKRDFTSNITILTRDMVAKNVPYARILIDKKYFEGEQDATPKSAVIKNNFDLFVTKRKVSFVLDSNLLSETDLEFIWRLVSIVVSCGYAACFKVGEVLEHKLVHLINEMTRAHIFLFTESSEYPFHPMELEDFKKPQAISFCFMELGSYEVKEKNCKPYTVLNNDLLKIMFNKTDFTITTRGSAVKLLKDYPMFLKRENLLTLDIGKKSGFGNVSGSILVPKAESSFDKIEQILSPHL